MNMVGLAATLNLKAQRFALMWAKEHFPEVAKLFTEKVKQLFLLRKHRNEPKKKQGKKKDKSVSRLGETSVVWKDNCFDYTHDLMTC